MPGEGCPMTRAQVIDRYFLEHRAKLLDIAAFLDRVDRAGSDDADEDYRIAAMRQAIKALLERGPDRARRVQHAFSDPTADPIASAAGLKGAAGAWPGPGAEAGEK